MYILQIRLNFYMQVELMQLLTYSICWLTFWPFSHLQSPSTAWSLIPIHHTWLVSDMVDSNVPMVVCEITQREEFKTM